MVSRRRRFCRVDVSRAMNAPLHARLRSAPAATGRIATELFHEMAPKVLFFFSAFVLIFLLFKLFVAQYSIEFFRFHQSCDSGVDLGQGDSTS